MTKEQQTMTIIAVGDLLAKVKEKFNAGYRLVQIGCTKLENNELTYAFDKDYQFDYFKLVLPADHPEVPSVSSIYWNAFLYENELHDLFGINFIGIVIDYKGNFYRTTQAEAFSFCERKAAPAQPAPQQDATKRD